MSFLKIKFRPLSNVLTDHPSVSDSSFVQAKLEGISRAQQFVRKLCNLFVVNLEFRIGRASFDISYQHICGFYVFLR